MKSFGEIIRQARKRNNLILRKVGAKMDIDQAIISKFERGERKPTREQVIRFADFYKLNKDELLTAWLSDKVIHILENESLAEEALKIAVKGIKHQRKTKLSNNE